MNDFRSFSDKETGSFRWLGKGCCFCQGKATRILKSAQRNINRGINKIPPENENNHKQEEQASWNFHNFELLQKIK